MDDVALASDTRPRLVSIDICQARWDDIWPECKMLMLDHRAEVGQEDSRAKLNPDHQAIRRLESLGGVFILSARSRSTLIGYAIWFLTSSIETTGLLVAQQGPWFVVEAMRSRGTGMMLWREAMKHFREIGVGLLLGHQPPTGPGSEATAKLFSRLGGKIEQTVWSIWLEQLGETEAKREESR